MKPRVLLAVALGLVLLGLGVSWWRTHERRDEWIDLPRSGEAARNPLYALRLALRHDGVRVQSRRRLQLDSVALAPTDTLLLFGDPSTITPTDELALLAWVRTGGHLILRTPPPDQAINLATRAFDGEGMDVPVLGEIGAYPKIAQPSCTGLAVRGEQPHVEFCRGRRFVAPQRAELTWGDPRHGAVFARVRPRSSSLGTVDVLADLDFLATDKLNEGPHIALTRQLLAPNYRAGTVHLVYDAQLPSLWSSLLRHGWMAWLPLLLALLAWLWQRTQRFGPLLPAPAGERRSLLEHIVASGEHTYRYGYGHLLHAAARTAFLLRLRRHDPLAAALEGEAQAALLAERFQLAPAEIRTALAAPTARDHVQFRARIATLIRLRNQL